MFELEQTYDLKALTALNRAARKTVRRRYMWLRAAVWLLLAVSLGVLLLSLAYGLFDVREDWGMLVCIAVMALFLAFDDRLNGWVSLRQMLPGTAHSVTTFTKEDYVVTTDTIETRYRYGDITRLCAQGDYLFFFLGKKHGQIFDLRGLRNGSAAEFRQFIEHTTGMTFQTV
ncbi:MAG: YcxB family protein [Oscillospiraceae bacterium]|nr:YcxB family protein [Oscillospiraceae bacterium]